MSASDPGMRTQVCLFCREDSSLSRSVEHVLPESLGNTTMVLPLGVVCDKCNNYFARKVEAPLLGSDPFVALRHFEGIPNKRGRIPSVQVATSLGATGELWVWPRSPVLRGLTLPFGAAVAVLRPGLPVEVTVPDRDHIPSDTLLGRFVCKLALETAAARSLLDPLAYASLLDTADLEACRRHARFGEGPTWTVRVNRIHPPDRGWLEGGRQVQRAWESDFLITPAGHLLFAVAIYGLELAINMLDRDVAAYADWLARAHSPSLLYPDGIPAAF